MKNLKSIKVLESDHRYLRAQPGKVYGNVHAAVVALKKAKTAKRLHEKAARSEIEH